MNLAIGAETIPTWLVAAVMVLTGALWFLIKDIRIRMQPGIFAMSYILWGLVYGIFFTELETTGLRIALTIGMKVFFLKTMLIMTCLSQYIPILISLIRSLERKDGKLK